MRLALSLRQLALARIREPREDDLPVLGALVQVVAAEAFVAEARHAPEQQAPRLLECLARFGVQAVRPQRLAVPPPKGWRLDGVERPKSHRAMCSRGDARRGECLGGLSGSEMRAGGTRQCSELVFDGRRLA